MKHFFRKEIENEKFDEAAEIARRQVKAGAQIIDVCLSNPDRDEVSDTIEFYKKVSKIVWLRLHLRANGEVEEA